MTALTYTQAVDEMFGVINTLNENASISTLISYKPFIHWQGVVQESEPDISKFYAKVSQQTVIETQKGHSMNVGEEGKKRYEVAGLIFVQLFAPQSVTCAMNKLRLWGELVKNALRIHKANVNFINVKINELPSKDSQFRLNVIAEYQYDEIV